jgi:DNA helicase-2/ATP-dependent DNA helicase PcrA
MSEFSFVPRPAQDRILAYSGGYMGISAVPGSGKTFTLSLLAARLVERLTRQDMPDEREVLVVTFTNTAAENFRSRIAGFLREHGLLPGVGYRVRTLHGLAHDIVRERPALVGLAEDFTILDERTTGEIKGDAVRGYLRTHPDALSPFILPEFLAKFRSIERYVSDDAVEIATNAISVAKDRRFDPQRLQAALQRQSGTWPLLEFGLSVFADYQRSLHVRGAVDFDDLITLALQALDADPGYLARLQDRWPYILEDEAQDSSALQEAMLRRLTARHGNWVRVGDPNQAINTTFTSANPRFLRDFMARPEVQAQDLPNSGRSTYAIIELANHLIDWSATRHPYLSGDLALTRPLIEMTPLGDPQPNPPPGNPPRYLHGPVLEPDKEIEVILKNVQRWLPDNRHQTVAILDFENYRLYNMSAALAAADIPFDDTLLRTSATTRAAAQALAVVVGYIAQPHLGASLDRLWSEVWWPQRGELLLADPALRPPAPAAIAETIRRAAARARKQELPEPVHVFGQALRKLETPEAFVFPVGSDWLDVVTWLDDVEGMRGVAEAFRSDVQRWTQAAILPIDELLLTLGQDLFTEPPDLALTHHLALMLAKLARENPTWRLPDLAGELTGIAENKRRLPDFTSETGGYEPKTGIVTLATMHAAKGLEWDRVYLMAVNSYNFPGGGPQDRYRGERWFVKENLNLVAEARAQVEQLAMGTLDDYVPGAASRQARLDIAAERLRLLYVGVTRARRELIITTNAGRRAGQERLTPALAFAALAPFSTTPPPAE